ncbi:MAG: flagellar assembly protein FliW [Lachnospiraceae bacterium]|nr:flagellar assembly protein FliW [Lachnospiraceae bacterium]
MTVQTRLFGEVYVGDDKIINLPQGIIGFPDLKQFTLIFDSDKEDGGSIMWFQSLDEPQFALPVMTPATILPDYNPTVNDELLAPLGELTEENLYVLVTVKVPQDLKEMSVNLKAPIIVNTDTMLGGQLIVEDEDLPVRYKIYDLVKGNGGD